MVEDQDWMVVELEDRQRVLGTAEPAEAEAVAAAAQASRSRSTAAPAAAAAAEPRTPLGSTPLGKLEVDAAELRLASLARQLEATEVQLKPEPEPEP